MNKSQAIADLSLQLSEVTTVERTQEIIQRALRATGLTNSPTLDETQLNELLQAISVEGGAIQEIAEQVAISGLSSTATDTTDGRTAA